ncbi:MAG: hypothetical protein KFB95_09195 [Simkaniaceae bacterium]|nr:MAG: hypothetical protein KFB95_09195 [Simkaniaceae bacterium]
MGLISYSTMGTNQYSSAVSADVVQALSKLSQADRVLANLNSMLSVVTSNNSLKEAKAEGAAQMKQGWSDAIGQCALGVMQIAGGAVAMSSATNYLSNLSDADEIDVNILKTQDERAKLENPGNVALEDGATDEQLAQRVKDTESYDSQCKELDDKLTQLNTAKAQNEKDQKVLEGKMKRTTGLEGVLNGVGQTSQAATKVYSAKQMQEATIDRALNGMMVTQAQQFGSQADQFKNEMNKPADQLAQMAQTVNK